MSDGFFRQLAPPLEIAQQDIDLSGVREDFRVVRVEAQGLADLAARVAIIPKREQGKREILVRHGG